MSSAVDPNRLWVEHLDGTGRATIVTSVICGFLSVVVVGLRCFVRSRDKTFGWDDGFMLGGVVSLPNSVSSG